MRILQWLLRTDSGVVDPILRITLAVVIFPQHGAQKVFGWFGGHGFKGTMKYFTDKADQCREKNEPIEASDSRNKANHQERRGRGVTKRRARRKRYKIVGGISGDGRGNTL
jgi:hypothetical protein